VSPDIDSELEHELAEERLLQLAGLRGMDMKFLVAYQCDPGSYEVKCVLMAGHKLAEEYAHLTNDGYTYKSVNQFALKIWEFGAFRKLLTQVEFCELP